MLGLCAVVAFQCLCVTASAARGIQAKQSPLQSEHSSRLMDVLVQCIKEESGLTSEQALSLQFDHAAEIDGVDNASGTVEQGARALQKLDIGQDEGVGVGVDRKDVNDDNGTNGGSVSEIEEGENASAIPPGPQPCDVPSFGHASFMHDDRYVPRSAMRGRGRGRCATTFPYHA
jgi:hypothetical protein